MHSDSCIYLRKGSYKYAMVHLNPDSDKFYVINEEEPLKELYVKVFSKPDFNSKIYAKEICPEHEKWKRDLINSNWYLKTIQNSTSIEKELEEFDKTFGIIYNILDNKETIFKFTSKTILAYSEKKDINYDKNKILWIKITKKYETWMPFRLTEIIN